jgi:hypothetical protein
MNELFRSEWKRYAGPAAGLALLHLAVLGFFTRIVDPLQQPLLVYRIAGLVYAIAGLGFGLVQIASHRRPSAWLFLLHRPVAPWRIAAAIVGSGALLVGLAIAAPLFAIVAGQAIWSARVVDARHFLLPLAAFLIAFATYLCGVYTRLSPARLALTALVVPIVAVSAAATGIAAVALQLLAVAAMLALAFAAFKPDLTTPPARVSAQIATSLPAAAAAYLVLAVVGGLAYQLGWIVLGSHPMNSVPPAGGLVEASRAEGGALLLAGLDAAAPYGEAEAAAIALEREQVRLSEARTVGPQLDRLPARGELANIAPVELDDAERNLRITFSHDTMRFHARDLMDGSAKATLGIGGAPGEPFDAVPLVAGERWAIAPSTVYEYDRLAGLFRPRLELPAGETIAAPPALEGETLAILSDRALLLYEPRTADEGAVLRPRLRVPLPRPIGDVVRVDWIERLDGVLVSIVVGRETIDAPGEAFQELLRVDGEGRATPIARREIVSDFPALLRHRRIWLSPLGAWATESAPRLLASSNPLAARAPRAIPASILAFAALVAAASAAASAALLRRSPAPRAVRVAWMAASLCGGPAVTIALWLLRPDLLPPAESRELPLSARGGASTPLAATGA